MDTAQARLRLAMFGALTIAVISHASSSIIYVNKNTIGAAHNGRSWQTAFTSVQEGLNAAVTNDEVWVAASTPAAPAYSENITMPRGSGLYGGFAGTETSRSQRNAKANVTVLDGNHAGTVVTVLQGGTIDGFTIRNGNPASGLGGGIYVDGTATVTVSNDVITRNFCSVSGGGIFVNGGSLVAVNDTISRNSSFFTAGEIYVIGQAVVTNASITGNSNGGIYLQSGKLTVTNATITGNSAAGIQVSFGTLAVRNSIVAFNTSGISVTPDLPSSVSHSDVYGNTAADVSGVFGYLGNSGNISVDPMLSSPYHDVHIQPSSPCVNAGDDSLVIAGETDIDGQPRLLGAHVDIGSDESDGLTWAATPGRIFHVSTSGNDANDGGGWAAAMRTVNAAIRACEGGDEVWVAKGTYVENVQLDAGIALYGGFAGAEVKRSQRDFKTNVTVLDGNRAGSVVAGSENVVVDGFTIRNGATSQRGAGIYATGDVVISNNVITSNAAQGQISTYATSTLGGGIYASGGRVAITHNIVSNNRVTSVGSGNGQGGGIYALGRRITVSDNTINGNSATSSGGGIFTGGTNTSISNDTVNGNAAATGGGINASSVSNITNSIVAFNSSGITTSAASTLSHNDVYGNGASQYAGPADPTGTYGNISIDPVLSNAYHDVSLEPSSPCIDGGDDSVITPGETDIDSQPRIQGPHVDIGSDESDGTVHNLPSLVFHVSSATGSDAANGLTWRTAMRTVAAAAAIARGGDEIWATGGIYKENIILPSGVGLYGAFAGNEKARKIQRSLQTNATVLDGGRAGTVLTVSQGDVISGVTVQNGSTPTEYGGGINALGSVTLTNDTVINNTANSGGGICVTGGSSRIANNIVAGNTAFRGGGIYATGGTFDIANNTISSNSAAYDGGGIYSNGIVSVQNTIVAFNSSGIYKLYGSLTLGSNDVFGNKLYDFTPVDDPAGAGGNISVDPLLSNTYNDAHLQPASPCVDAGDDSAVGFDDTDIDGQPRIQGGHVDIGTDESDGLPHIVTPHIWHVSAAEGDDTADGLTWATARKTVGAATTAAKGGDEVWVAMGTYPENVAVPSGVALYGGFAGTESDRSLRNARMNPTVLDGGQSGTVVTGLQDLIVDGFTIRNGKTSGNGGGIAANGDATVTNDTIVGNSAVNGGGIYSTGGVLDVDHSIITNNSASATGGGINAFSSLTNFANDVVADNLALKECGGIYVAQSTATFTNDTITGNSSAEIGAIDLDYQCSAKIASTIVAFNSSGIYEYGSNLNFLNDDVYGNSGYNVWRWPDPVSPTSIDADPLFVNATGGDYHLTPASPCIDAGDETPAAPGATDLDGGPRQVGGRVDIGAYEYPTPPVYSLMGPIYALRIAAGLSPGSPDDVAGFNAQTGDSDNTEITIGTAARLARLAAGLGIER